MKHGRACSFASLYEHPAAHATSREQIVSQYLAYTTRLLLPCCCTNAYPARGEARNDENVAINDEVVRGEGRKLEAVARLLAVDAGRVHLERELLMQAIAVTVSVAHYLCHPDRLISPNLRHETLGGASRR